MRKKSLCMFVAISMSMTMLFSFMAPAMGNGPYPNTSSTIQAAAPAAEPNEYTEEVVPQVRWAGEKIVLEKYLGPAYEHQYVRFP
jgi:hypothetical protein